MSGLRREERLGLDGTVTQRLSWLRDQEPLTRFGCVNALEAGLEHQKRLL